MAKKPKAQPRELLDRALEVVATKGWARTTLAALAEGTGEPAVELYRRFGSKLGLIDALTAHVDEAMLVAQDPDLFAQPPRDRLFELLMRRFDALEPHKDAMRAIVRDGFVDPLLLVRSRSRLLRSMALALEAAGLSSSGLRGLVRTRVLAAIHLATLRVWLGDDSPDMAKTMAELDRRLRQAESLAGRFGGEDSVEAATAAS